MSRNSVMAFVKVALSHKFFTNFSTCFGAVDAVLVVEGADPDVGGIRN